MGRVRFTTRLTSKWLPETEGKLDLSVLDAVTDIHREASILAPKASRALVNSGRVKREGPAHYKVIFGGGAVPYARRRHFENKKTPGSLRYLERPGDTTSRNFKRYIKGI
jgi:hypothetical protein